jgi:hypothetical protein
MERRFFQSAPNRLFGSIVQVFEIPTAPQVESNQPSWPNRSGDGRKKLSPFRPVSRAKIRGHA